jgi:hypothetical protein
MMIDLIISIKPSLHLVIVSVTLHRKKALLLQGGGSWRRTRRRRWWQRRQQRRRLHIAGVVAFYCEDIFLCGIFIMCGGNWRGDTSPHTLVTLEVCRCTFGWGRKLSSKIVVCKYQKLASKKAWQLKLVVFYRDDGSYTSRGAPSFCPHSHGFFARNITFWQ